MGCGATSSVYAYHALQFEAFDAQFREIKELQEILGGMELMGQLLKEYGLK